MSIFKRPHNLVLPTTYYTFKARDVDSDEIVEYRVQDLPQSHFGEALTLLEEFFIPDEELCISRGILKSPAAIAEMVAKMFNEHLSIACFKNDQSNELVSVNVLVVSSKGDLKDDTVYKDERVIDVLAVIEHMTKQIDVFEAFNVSSYLAAYGLVVNDKYRGRGIATEMLKARVPLLNALGLKVTSTLFTGVGSQTAAKKASYEDIYSIRYAELKNLKPQFGYINAKSEYCKMMALKIT